MFRRKSKQDTRERATEYASCRDFQQIFTEDMMELHRLAFLLTADQAKAEQCFVAGLEESIHGNPVFRQWARAWSKRAIIQNAIKTVTPVPPQRRALKEMEVCSSPNESGRENIAANVPGWTPFERFVFVMAVLEGYSLRECSALLACSTQDVIAAKSLALQRLAEQPWQGPTAPQRDDIQWTAKFARAQAA